MRRDPIGAGADVFPVSRRALAPLVDEIAGVKSKPPRHCIDRMRSSRRTESTAQTADRIAIP